MATEDKGSDLDVFEGLSKKAPGASTPPPPGAPAPPPAPPSPSGTLDDDPVNRTLLGMSSSRTTPVPPPPPGRATLPPVAPAAIEATTAPRPGVDVDWDDEDEATHIFDKGDDVPRSAAPAPAAGAPAGVALKSTLLGLTPPLQPGMGPSPTGRFSPPPPGMPVARNPSSGSMAALPPPALGTLPPPPATLTGLGAALPSRSLPPPPLGGMPIPPGTMPGVGHGTLPPPRLAAFADQPMIRPSTELTALLHPRQSRAALWTVAALVAGFFAVAIFLLIPHTGHIVINVSDPRGLAVGRVDIFIDGRKQCDTAPCIVDQLSAGLHDVKVLADGYEPPPVQQVNVEARKEASATFSLGSASRGTGMKITGTQPGVKLYVDDREIGPLPQELRDLSPGDHIVKLVGSERYQPLERRVNVPRDAMLDLGTVTLKVLKGKATVSLGTPGARVFLVSGTDRRELPMLPISVDIDTTKMWALQATRPGFQDYNQAISFDDGQAEKTYVVQLEPRSGGTGGQGYWAPPPAAAAPAPAPVERERERAPSPAPAPAPVAAAGGGGGGGEGFLNINSIPPSTCFVDGRQLGPTPKVHIPVSAGTHQVKFVNADQQLTKTISVSVGAGATQMAVAKLN